MKFRIRKKIYRRADTKVKLFITINNDSRSTLEIADSENILSGIERMIFIHYQKKTLAIFTNIIDEVKVEENEQVSAAKENTACAMARTPYKSETHTFRSRRKTIAAIQETQLKKSVSTMLKSYQNAIALE